MHGRARRVALLVLFVLAPRDAGAWGWQVHTQLNRAATTHLPPQFAAFAQWADSLAELAAAADMRRCCDPDEAARHFIDIDAYDEFFARTLPRTYPEMLMRFGRERVQSNGVLPWAIESTLARLTQSFRDRDWRAAVATAADLGHYVADGHQPLHITSNYDGQLSGQRGVHARYETTMLELYLPDLEIPPGHTSAYARPVDAVFEWIERVYPGVTRLLRADARATRAARGDVTSPIYYDVLWRETEADTRLWLRQASLAIAAMWLTAWYDAGSPPLPGSSGIGTPVAALSLFPNEPNPFNPWTTLRFQVTGSGRATLRVHDVRGRVVRTLLDGDAGSGERSLAWDGRDDDGRPVAAGAYRIRLEQRGQSVARSAVLVR